MFFDGVNRWPTVESLGLLSGVEFTIGGNTFRLAQLVPVGPVWPVAPVAPVWPVAPV